MTEETGAGAPGGDGQVTGAGASDGGEPPAGGDPAPSPPADWKSGLPEELRNDPSIANVKGVEDLAKEHVNVQRLIGKRGVTLPGKDATAEEWDSFYNEIGRPESADQYDLKDFKPPEGLPWNADLQGKMVEKAHAHGLTQTQLRGMIGDYAEAQAAEWQAFEQRASDIADANEEQLRQDWGSNFDANIEHANRMVRAGFDDIEGAKQIRLMDGTYLLDNLAVAKAFAKIGAALGEDGDLPGDPLPGVVSGPEAAQAEIEKIRAAAAEDPNHPYNNKKHPEHKAIHKRMYQLYEVAGSDGGHPE